MLNGVGINNDLNNSQLNGQIGVNGVTTNPINNPYKNVDKNLFIDETSISDDAINLYQHEQDVKQFTKLATSNPENLSHNDIIDGLFNSGASDLFSDEALEELSGNQRLIDDISVL